MQDLHDFEIILNSRVPLIVIETHEEQRALQLIVRAGVQRKLPVFAWSCTEGISRVDFDAEIPERLTQEPEAALRHVKAGQRASIWVLCDFHPFLDAQPKLVRLLKEIALQHERVPHCVIFLSHALQMPAELSRYSARMSLRLPTEQELLHLVREEAAQWSRNNQAQKVRTDSTTLEALVANLRGLTFADARRLARGAIVNDGAITSDDIPEVNRAKFLLMSMEGVLTYEYDTASFSEVGGLASLKNWLAFRRKPFVDVVTDVAGIDVPKGIMLLGVQGSGKSLAAKATAGTLGVPLLRLDFAALYNKFIGETERNLREALKLADLMSPCVLWIDEIEKGLGGDGSDNGVSKRVLGTLLTWMSERKSRVFMVATSNDISGLPPELVRKGRLDEIFFVDLPTAEIRQQIFSIHLGKRAQDGSGFDLKLLADATDGFSGAEIEQVVVAALYSCAASKSRLQSDDLLREIANTTPLSLVMAESIGNLRAWAKDRTVPAN